MKNKQTVSTAFNKVLSLIQHLSPPDQLLLSEELAGLIRHKNASKTRRSILEIQGLGKEIWKEVDIHEYLDKERSSWNG